MAGKSNTTPEAAELRRRAEESLRAKHPDGEPAETAANLRRLVHELQVHQIELELQNEELQSARNELELGLGKYSDLFDFAPVGLLTLDGEGTICEANLASAALLKIERPRLLKRRFGLYVAPEDRTAFADFLRKVLASKKQECCEVKVLNKGNPAVDVRIEGLASKNGQECRAVLVDITEQKRFESDRLVLNRLEATLVLAGGIAHDFNNLLTAILLDIEVAQTLPEGRERVRVLEDAKKAARAGGDLTQELISFARGGVAVRKPTDLSGVIQQSVRGALQGSKVRSEFSLAANLWRAEVDAGQMGQVFRNLAMNASEAMPEGGTISVRAENVVQEAKVNAPLPPGDYVRVTFEDQGGGIAKEALRKVFDPYYSTKDRGSPRGIGLGLTICYAVIRSHGGAISVTSEAGAGASFQIDLPACRTASGEKKVTGPVGRPRQGKVLLMDDEEPLRKAIGQTLWGLGQDVEATADGQTAVRLYQLAKDQGVPFDLVILDLSMNGGMGGLETFQALRQIDPGVKAILLSGFINDPVMMEYARHGFEAVVEKPFNRQDLQEMLVRVLGPQGETKIL